MTIEVHSFGREVSPRRTFVTALSLLIICSGLAWGMSRKRAGDPLVSVLTPSDWQVRFRVPRRFETGAPVLTREVTALPFFGTTPDDHRVDCVLWKIPGAGSESLELTALVILQRNAGGSNWFGQVKPLPPKSEPLGVREGLELMSASESAIVRIAMVRDDAYAVSFAVHRSKIDPALYQLFDLTCRSMTEQGK